MQPHFFVDYNALDTQTTNAFGPVTGNETTEFRVNSIHSAAAFANYSAEYPNPRSYAICEGHVRVFENTKDSTLLNVVLQPTKEDFNGLPVKYIIYRGILKASICDNGNLIIEPGTYAGGTVLNNVFGPNEVDHLIDYGFVHPTQKNLDILGPCFKSTVAITDPFYRSDSDPISSVFFESEPTGTRSRSRAPGT